MNADAKQDEFYYTKCQQTRTCTFMLADEMSSITPEEQFQVIYGLT